MGKENTSKSPATKMCKTQCGRFQQKLILDLPRYLLCVNDNFAHKTLAIFLFGSNLITIHLDSGDKVRLHETKIVHLALFFIHDSVLYTSRKIIFRYFLF